MSAKEEKKELRASLESKFHDIIEEIQEHYGLNSVSETLRLIIKRYYEDIFKKIKESKNNKT